MIQLTADPSVDLDSFFKDYKPHRYESSFPGFCLVPVHGMFDMPVLVMTICHYMRPLNAETVEYETYILSFQRIGVVNIVDWSDGIISVSVKRFPEIEDVKKFLTSMIQSSHKFHTLSNYRLFHFSSWNELFKASVGNNWTF